MGDIGRDRRPGGNQVISRPVQFRVRPDHPFDGIDVSALRSVDQVIEKIIQYSTTLTHLPPPESAKASAVLIALFQGDQGAEVVLTRRSQQLTNHRGEVSFPGGRIDIHERAVDTALREAHEEINLSPDCVEIVGQLNPTATLVSNSHIVPLVARLKDKPSLEVSNTEVERVFTVPLIELIRPDTYAEEFWGAPSREYRLHFFHLDDETIWGVTGQMLYQLLSVAIAT